MIQLSKTTFDGPGGPLIKADYRIAYGESPWRTLYVPAASLAGLKRDLMQVAEREIDEALDSLLGDGVLYEG